MPEPVFALSREAVQQGCYGLYSRVPILPTQFRQAKSWASGGTSNLTSVPLQGSVLFVIVAANSATTGVYSITGGGVGTWNLIANTAVGGANNTVTASWWGVVTGTPSATITATVAGSQVGGANMELMNLLGTELYKNGTGGGATSTLSSVRTSRPAGVLVALSAGFGTLTLPSGLTTGSAQNVARTSGVQYSPAAVPANTTLSLTLADASARGNLHAVIIA